MLSLRELEVLEQMHHETGLVGDALTIKFNERNTDVAPYYRHKPDLLANYFKNIYREISEWRTWRRENIDDTTELLPPFDAWCGRDILDCIEEHENFKA